MIYDTESATLIATDVYLDGKDFTELGRNAYLLRTPNGRYFRITLFKWAGKRDYLTPVSMQEACYLYEEILPYHILGYDEAFPEYKLREA